MSVSSSAYPALTGLLRRQQVVESIGDLLNWDEQVNLPPGAAQQRADQCGVWAEIAHAGRTSAEAGALLTVLQPAELAPDERTVVAHAQREYDRATRLPPDFVRAKAAQASVGYHVWAAARAANDFSRYIPVLDKNLELARQEAEYLGWGAAPYDCMLDQHDPGMTAATIAPLFAELKTGLVPLVQQIAAAAVRPPQGVLRGAPEAGQRVFLREVTERLGFDYARGRIDVSLHPFCSGSGDDVRMTTRFQRDEPLDSLFSSIHETGHGLYEQGLPRAHRGTALGIHAGMAVHESQSRLWENQVSRSRGFWRFFEPRLRELFPAETAGVSSADLYLAINAVEPTPVRTESDEVTYNLHILLRFDLEQALFAGRLAVRDLPAAWTAGMQDLLGLTPADDRQGVLQDVHWSGGAFGYFPSYCLGNMMAAQLWFAAHAEHPQLEEDFSRGDFGWLLAWLRQQVHAQGRRYDLLTLVQRVTGAPLTPQPLLRYLQERYGSLYLR